MPETRQGDEVDFGELVQTLLAEWRIVLGAAVIALALAVAYVLLIAPDRYQATAVLRGMDRVLCPPAIGGCDVSLETALGQAAQRALTPAAIEALDPELGLLADPEFKPKRGEPTAVSVAREVADAVDIRIDGARARVTARHGDEQRAVALANGFVTFMQQEIETERQNNLAVAERALQRSLALLPPVSPQAGEFAAVIGLRQSELAARLEFVAEARAEIQPAASVEVPAQLPADQLSPDPVRMSVLGLLAGLTVGVAAALLRAARRGTLYSRRQIVEAFGGGAIVERSARVTRQPPAASVWQEVRVLLGSDGGAVAILSAGNDEATLAAGVGLASEVASGGTSAALLDLGERFPRSGAADAEGGVYPVGVDTPVPAYGCASGDLASALAALGARHDAVILLAPPLTRNLVVLNAVFKAATARVILLRGGRITRGDVARVLVAEHGAPARRVLVLAT